MGALLLLGMLVQDEAEIRAALAQLESEYLDERLKALTVLEGAGRKAEPVLIEALSSDDRRVRVHAIRLLAKLGSTKPVDAIGAIFQSAVSFEVRDAAFDYLLAVPGDAERYLIPALEHARLGIRSRALEALGRAKSVAAIPTVGQLYEREKDETLREAAFVFLAQRGEAAEDEMIRLLGSADPKVRSKVLSVAGQNLKSDEGTRAIGAQFLVEVDPNVLKEAHAILSARTGEVTEGIYIRALSEGKLPAQRLAVPVLSSRNSEAGVEPAGRLFVNNRDPQICELLVQYLKDRDAARGFFHEAVTSASGETAAAAIDVLREHADYGSADAAAGLYRSTEPDALRESIVAYLSASGDLKHERVLIRALDDKREGARRHAIEGLGKLQTPTAVGALARKLADVDSLEQRAIRDALARMSAAALWAILTSDEAAAMGEETRREIEGLHVRVAIEEHLDAGVAAGQGIGTYAGQFDGLTAEPLDAARVEAILREMIKADYVYISDPSGPWPLRYRRQLAVLALAAVAGEGAADVLEAAWKEDVERYAGMSQMDLKLVFVTALHRVGRPGPAEKLGAWMETFGKEQFESGSPSGRTLAYEVWFYRAMLLARRDKLEAAASAYEALLAKVDERFEALGALHYNLGCVKARQGKTADALASLQKAVEAGFKDRAWFERDRDLAGLRDLPAFKDLIASLPE